MIRPLASFVALAFLFGVAQAQAPRALPQGEAPPDARLAPPKDLNGYFPFTPPTDVKEWEAERARLRRRTAVALGIWPEPEKTPLNAVIHGARDMGDYTVEKVYFESMPGFHCTGSLYRPKGKEGKRPGVLCPHGHWPEGRFYDNGPEKIKQEIVIGAERFADSGRSPLQARCMQLARMGCVVFHYDMIGYADSQQISFEIAHRFAKQRPEMNNPDAWGLFSPQAENRLQSVMGLQTWNSIRALDFLLTLPDVDGEKIACTGASGGGTQTFILGALDDRVKVAFPAVMVSTAMQGGCTCENASCLRTMAGNIHFASMFAPRPQAMTSANDWTLEMATKGFPDILATYRMYGAPDNVKLVNGNHFQHNYNYVSRAAMYAWFNKHLGLGQADPVVEEDFKRLTKEEMTVYDDKHPRPDGGPEFEKKLLARWDADSQVALSSKLPKTAGDLANWQADMDLVVETLIARPRPQKDKIKFEATSEGDAESFSTYAGLLKDEETGSANPTVFLKPKKWSGRVVVWLSDQGKAGLFGADGKPNATVAKLLASEMAVTGIDLLFQGESLGDGKAAEANRIVANEREFAGYTYGYNPSLLAQRARDVAVLANLIRNHPERPTWVSLVAIDETVAPVAAAATAYARGGFDHVAIDTRGFRFAKLTDYRSPSFLVGAAKYGDLPGLLAVGAPKKLKLYGEKETPTILVGVYSAAGNAQGVESGKVAGEAVAADVVAWLAKP